MLVPGKGETAIGEPFLIQNWASVVQDMLILAGLAREVSGQEDADHGRGEDSDRRSKRDREDDTLVGTHCISSIAHSKEKRSASANVHNYNPQAFG
jgi:hypothetical protein